MGYGYGPSWGMMSSYGFGYGLIHIVISVIVIAAVVFLVLRLVRTIKPAHAVRQSSGLDVLEERYARGEINRDEYLQKKEDIAG